MTRLERQQVAAMKAIRATGNAAQGKVDERIVGLGARMPTREATKAMMKRHHEGTR